MKKNIVFLFSIFAITLVVNAQDKAISTPHVAGTRIDSLPPGITNLPSSGRKIDTVKVEVPNIYVWKITPRLGERIFIPRDSAVIDFHQSMLVDGKDVAVGYLGNIGSPLQSKIFFNRPETSRFIFLDPVRVWRKNPEDQIFYNTKVPYSEIKYQSGGGGQSAENRFQGEITMNMGKKLNVGFDFDYIYSRGFYNSLSNKGVTYDFYASYIGDKYKMHALFHNNNFTIIENGGITNPLYITNPDDPSIEEADFKGNSLDIPTRMTDTWNRMRGRHLYVTNRYDLGNDSEEYPINDSVMGIRKKKDYIPLASAIFTTHYTDQRRRFNSTYAGLDDLYTSQMWDNSASGWKEYVGEEQKSFKYEGNADDYMSYYSFKNTLALAMNEGFRKWTKFGLTAFIEYDMRKYSMPDFMVNDAGQATGMQGSYTHYSQNALFVGGVLSKEKGKYLRYKATAEKDLINSDYRLEGEVTTKLNFKNKDFSVKATAYIKNISPSFFQDNFSSKYWNWKDMGLKDTRKVFIGGEIVFPELSFSKTKISGGVETISGQIYYDSIRLVAQEAKDVQVISLRLDQNFQAGIFHWDNQVVWQYSSNQKVVPLPTLSVYSNIYITTKLARVLTLQLGADAHFHTKYYMPGYEPLTMQFYNQRDTELGNFPVTTAYMNLHLKYTRFFVMMYNLTNGMGNGESFSLYRYPVNPRILKLGISWRFNN
jgi:hypothetical protein